MEKMTKVERFEALITLVDSSAMEAEMKEDMISFLQGQIEQIAKKAAKAKEKAAEKKAATDELYDAVAAVLTGELQTIKEIMAQIEGEDLTSAKIASRLKKMVTAGTVEKETVKREGSKSKVMAYRLIS